MYFYSIVSKCLIAFDLRHTAFDLRHTAFGLRHIV